MIWKMDKEKALGPDGFDMAFLQACWSIVKDDLMNVFYEFYYNVWLPIIIDSTLITLVPRKNRSIKV